MNKHDKQKPADRTNLWQAANRGNNERVEKLLQNYKQRHEDAKKIDAVDKHGNTALMIAANSGRLETMRILLNHGADVSITNPDGENVQSVTLKNIDRFGDRSRQKDVLDLLLVDRFVAAKYLQTNSEKEETEEEKEEVEEHKETEPEPQQKQEEVEVTVAVSANQTEKPEEEEKKNNEKEKEVTEQEIEVKPKRQLDQNDDEDTAEQKKEHKRFMENREQIENSQKEVLVLPPMIKYDIPKKTSVPDTTQQESHDRLASFQLAQINYAKNKYKTNTYFYF